MDFLYDHTENTRTRFVSFVGKTNRFDLAITVTDRFYGKLLILNLQSSRFAIIGEDDLEEEGYLEYVFQLSTEEAEELRDFIYALL
jgi:hypothetical protein